MTMNTDAEPAPYHQNPPPHRANRSRLEAADTTLEFGHFRVLLRQRRLVADGVRIELGTRAFDLLLALLEADGSLVTKDELLSRVWPGIVVAEENLKVQISALRKALGEDRDFIRTEFGRGYRFNAAVRATIAWTACGRTTRRGRRSNQRSVPGKRRTVGAFEVTLADSLIQLTPRPPRPAGTSEKGCDTASLPRRPASSSI